MICSNCGTVLEDDTFFCPKCGTRISSVMEPESDTEIYAVGSPEYSKPVGSNVRSRKPAKKVDAKITSIICYLTWIGLVVMYCIGDNKKAKVHLNNSTLLTIARTFFLYAFFRLEKMERLELLTDLLELLCVFGFIASVVFWFIGFINACSGKNDELPLIGKIHIL